MRYNPKKIKIKIKKNEALEVGTVILIRCMGERYFPDRGDITCADQKVRRDTSWVSFHFSELSHHPQKVK
jgi:hypothetical protein